MRVKALERCFVDGALREEGDVFDFEQSVSFKDPKKLNPVPKYLEPVVPRGTMPAPKSAASNTEVEK